MGRLTSKNSAGEACILLYSDPDSEQKGFVEELARKQIRAIEKLAQYEDLEEPDPETGLKPCPFCGGKAILRKSGAVYVVSCDNNKCNVLPSTYGNRIKEWVIEAWNKRAGEQE